MKRTIKHLLALALIVLANVSFAGFNDEYFSVEVTGSRTFNLSIRNITGFAEVVIYDQSGDILYQNEMNEALLVTKKFDLSKLPSGNYQLKYKDDFKIQTLEIRVGKELFFDYGRSTINYVPVVTHQDGILNIGKVADGEDKLTIYVYDENGELLVNKKVSGEKYIGKRFDLSKVPSGTYNVVVQSNNETYTKKIKI